MLKIKEAIVVEGRYDKNTLSQLVDTVILETAGFGIFKDKEKLSLLRKIGEKRGLIILTDSDGAGFVIRNYLKGALPQDQVKHAYVPDLFGKEKRKRKPGKEGKLGVEGMPGGVGKRPPSGRGHHPGGGNPESRLAAASHQGRSLRLRPVRRGGEQGEAAGPSEKAGSAPASHPQRHAAGALRPLRPGEFVGRNEKSVIKSLRTGKNITEKLPLKL